ncbi:MAG: ABC transporter permease DevC [Planctomycetes bacterium]|nr:ABC transporter permease DevC [Planctomycetota bacterium]
MKTPLAWRNLVHNKVRTAVAVAGVAFAVVLIFMQLGFRGSVMATATLIYDALEFDVLIRSAEYLHFADARTFPQSRLPVAASAPGVAGVAPFYVQLNEWRNPQTGTRRGILVMGVSPGRPAFRLGEVRRKARRLTSPEFVLIDRKSRREFGPRDPAGFGDADVGVRGDLGGTAVQIAGHFALGAGLAADGSVVASDRGFARVTPGRTVEDLTFGLVRIEDGANPEAVAARLAAILPGDVEVLTRDEVEAREIDRWLNETPIGLIFRMGVVIALIVGVAIVYQVLSSDVTAHLGEYATLKAMGYPDRKLSGVVVGQALILALLGFVPGLVASLLLYEMTSYFANIPIEMTWTRVGGVLLLTILMCAASGVAALRKVWVADPAELF